MMLTSMGMKQVSTLDNVVKAVPRGTSSFVWANSFINIIYILMLYYVISLLDYEC